jgi:peptidoglycan/xylan/chitin deacetylase (PgdA/CDA1 family)
MVTVGLATHPTLADLIGKSELFFITCVPVLKSMKFFRKIVIKTIPYLKFLSLISLHLSLSFVFISIVILIFNYPLFLIPLTLITLLIMGVVLYYLSRFHLFGECYRRINTLKPLVALTFDDGPSPPYTNNLLEILELHKVKATFFMIGRNIEEHPDVAKAVVVQKHEIGNHSYSHTKLLIKSPDFVRLEIERTDLLLRHLGVTREIHFRSPFGAQLFSVPLVLWEKKKKNILFDVAPRDWETQETDIIVQRVINQIKPGSIILLHDGEQSPRFGTVKATDMIIRELKKRNFKFVTVSQLLTYQSDK